MISKKARHPEMHTTYLLRCGQTLEGTKPSQRTRALLAPKSAFQRFVDYTTVEERTAAQQQKEAAKITALKQASYEKTKTWSDTIENIKARRREGLLSKRQKAEDERKMFVKEMTEKKAVERAEVVQQARKLILQKKPLCRRFNRALLASECLRELDAQVAFQKTIKEMDKKRDVEYAKSFKTNVAMHEEKQKAEEEERAKKNRNYKLDLKKQIDENEESNKLRAAEEKEAERNGQRRMSQEMQITKEREMQDILNKKKKLQQFFKDAIEEKKRFESELKRDEEFQDLVLEVYQKSKDRIQKLHKSITLKEKEEKARQTQIILEQCSAIKQINRDEDKRILERAIKEKEMIEEEKQKAQKEREEALRSLIEEFKLQDTAVKAKRTQEEKDWKAWEMMQRFKRAEYDRQFNLGERKRQLQQKQEYRNELQRDIEEKQIEKQRDEVLEAAAADMKATMEKANRRILLYGDEILEESRGVRPLHPIIKAVEECKKEMGLIPRKKLEESVSAEQPKRKRKVRRVCTKPVPADQIYYLQ